MNRREVTSSWRQYSGGGGHVILETNFGGSCHLGDNFRGGHVILETIADDSRILWLFQEGGRIIIERISDYALKLSIFRLRPTDTANYTCHADNHRGTFVRNGTITVQCKWCSNNLDALKHVSSQYWIIWSMKKGFFTPEWSTFGRLFILYLLMRYKGMLVGRIYGFSLYCMHYFVQCVFW